MFSYLTSYFLKQAAYCKLVRRLHNVKASLGSEYLLSWQPLSTRDVSSLLSKHSTVYSSDLVKRDNPSSRSWCIYKLSLYNPHRQSLIKSPVSSVYSLESTCTLTLHCPYCEWEWELNANQKTGTEMVGIKSASTLHIFNRWYSRQYGCNVTGYRNYPDVSCLHIMSSSYYLVHQIFMLHTGCVMCQK